MSEQRQYCTFHVDGQYFGIEVEKVQEIVRYREMTPVPLAPPVIGGLINLRGQIVTTIELRRRLHYAERPAGLRPMNVVLRIDEGAVSLLVDEIGDVLELGPETFEPRPETVRGPTRELILGAHKLQDRLLLLLDTEKLLELR
jgi:purine-binding chemotaxis protein CheW